MIESIGHSISWPAIQKPHIWYNLRYDAWCVGNRSPRFQTSRYASINEISKDWESARAWYEVRVCAELFNYASLDTDI